MNHFVCIALGVLCSITGVNGQYLHANGTKIVNGNNQEVLLRGMGLGGWMLQEGYMLETAEFAGSQHEIRATISALIGDVKTDEFYDAWYNNHCTKADIDSLNSWGFNSVRLPMHYNLFTLPIADEPVEGGNTWLNRGFDMVDELLLWCAANEMYLILDLHGAPGGQGRDANISDYDASKPSLWESDLNKAKTVALWKKLAERYANKEWIGGYDLLNEPNWNFTGSNQNGCDESTNAPLRQLYVDIVAAIREVDQNHIIYIEGNCWANNHNGLLPFWDDNMVLSFHKYWSNNNQEDLNWVLEKRDQYDVPLWMGEAGENSNTWFRNSIKLFEDNDIGWAWWPMKKIGSVVGPLTVERTEGYDQLLDYWKNGGEKPSEEFAINALMEMAEELLIENNTYHPDVIDAMIRQVSDNSTKPFKAHSIPGIMNATDYDLGRNSFAYYDTDTANYNVSTGNYTTWNTGWSYRNDGVDIEVSEDTHPNANGYNVGWTSADEWMQYTVDVASSAGYSLTLRYASGASAKIHIEVDDKNISHTIALPSTGGWQIWDDITIENLVMYQGNAKVRIYFEEGSANLSYFNFLLTDQISDIPISVVSGKTNVDGDSISLNFNKKMDPSSIWATSDFSISIDGQEVTIQSIDQSGVDAAILNFQIDAGLYDDDASILISYSGAQIVDEDLNHLDGFTDFEIKNERPFHHKIPSKIEAEDYIENQGLSLESTDDSGGGFNIAYTNAGDYLVYLTSVAESGHYNVDVRVAGKNEGILKLEQFNESGNLLNTAELTVPNTGDWQDWETIQTDMSLDNGIGTIKLTIVDPEFNVNWLRFTKSNVTSTSGPYSNQVMIYPNPVTNEQISVSGSNDTHYNFQIFDLSGVKIMEKNNLIGDKTINTKELKSGLYIWVVAGEFSLVKGKIIID